MPNKTQFNYSALRGKIKEVFGTEGKFAESLGRTQNYLSKVWKGESFFTQPDIEKACGLLSIEVIDIGRFFFQK